ncbi:glycoside hydrolase family 32 protein [Brachybacterium huguangmaarense]|uniref:beta-fructofuranosidase n=1 Tax=Brachybacterium huguangmaarense TaxID=1652028 RepID=A0ABY6G516_9MICO|nr:glycoside hydrolase family 32 protein [Brachybacterium huguangmaarense]UYG17743.1 glycoside hydrolase family 32 protein [Brachybacterium huguangmaarense]
MTSDPFPSLHRVQARGWLNDPNGIVRHDGRWHVFFQYNPDSPRHERIHWGHVSSDDLVSWREEPLGPAPRPGEADEGGCWSGVATVHDGAVHAVYSGVSRGHVEQSRVVIQRANADLTAFEPLPGTAADAPDESGLVAVRDPFLLELDGRALAIQGAGLRRRGADGVERMVPAILAWDRSDLTSWRYLGPVLTGEETIAGQHAPADVWECPQLVRLGRGDEARWALALSLWTTPPEGGFGPDRVSWLLGDLTWHETDGEDDRTGLGPLRFSPATGGPLDAGPDFYAPQAHVDPASGRVLLWAWSWEGAERTAEQAEAQGWAGCLTFPRELDLEHGRVVSRVPAELRTLRGAPLPVGDDGAVLPPRAEARSEQGARVELIGEDGTVLRVIAEEPHGPVTVFVDASILELLPEQGVPQTVRVYPGQGESLRVRALGGASDLRVWELRRPSA